MFLGGMAFSVSPKLFFMNYSLSKIRKLPFKERLKIILCLDDFFQEAIYLAKEFPNEDLNDLELHWGERFCKSKSPDKIIFSRFIECPNVNLEKILDVILLYQPEYSPLFCDNVLRCDKVNKYTTSIVDKTILYLLNNEVDVSNKYLAIDLDYSIFLFLNCLTMYSSVRKYPNINYFKVVDAIMAYSAADLAKVTVNQLRGSKSEDKELVKYINNVLMIQDIIL